jgi:hypothetical protein
MCMTWMNQCIGVQILTHSSHNSEGLSCLYKSPAHYKIMAVWLWFHDYVWSHPLALLYASILVTHWMLLTIALEYELTEEFTK